jgi:hypothetical protein
MLRLHSSGVASGRRKEHTTGCPFPDKDKLTRKEATERANGMTARGKQVFAYRCPSGGHSHVGSRPPTIARLHWRH